MTAESVTGQPVCAHYWALTCVNVAGRSMERSSCGPILRTSMMIPTRSNRVRYVMEVTMTPKILKLGLYRNCDPKQSIYFTGSTNSIILSKLKTWMNENNGEDGKPCEVDGLTLTVYEEEAYEIYLTWDECYLTWELAWDGEETTSFDKWNQARNAFIDACSYEIWPEEPES